MSDELVLIIKKIDTYKKSGFPYSKIVKNNKKAILLAQEIVKYYN